MEVIEKKENVFVFRAKMEDTLANSLRRSVGRIPTMAIDEVEIARNDSALYDETLAHRMGLVPLRMEKGMKEGEVKKFKLKVKKDGFVYSGEIKGDVEVVYDQIPLTLLNEGQEIEVKGTTKLGIGNDHSKFSPGFLVYRNEVEIVMDKMFLDNLKNAFPEIEVKEKGNKIVVFDNLSKSIKDFCEGISQKNKKEIEVKDTDYLILTLESFGQMDSKDIFKKALEILKKDLKEAGKLIK